MNQGRKGSRLEEDRLGDSGPPRGHDLCHPHGSAGSEGGSGVMLPGFIMSQLRGAGQVTQPLCRTGMALLTTPSYPFTQQMIN